MPTIRTVFHPDTTHEVDDHEAAQLAREGLLLPLETEEPPAAPGVAPALTASKSAAAKAAPMKEASTDGDEAQ